MKSFEDFRNSILGKIYRQKYSGDKIYLVVDVCGRSTQSDIDAKIDHAIVIYISISVPSKRNTISYYGDNSSITIGNSEVEFTRSSVLSNLREEYCIDSEVTLNDIANYYKATNGEIKELLKNVGVQL